MQFLAVAAVLGLHINPLDEVLGDHGVIDGTHIHMNLAALDLHNGDVLFTAGFHRIGNQLLHPFAAAEHGNLCVVNHFYLITAVTADIKLLHIVILLFFGELFFFMASVYHGI
jgi:hypothetical protein